MNTTSDWLFSFFMESSPFVSIALTLRFLLIPTLLIAGYLLFRRTSTKMLGKKTLTVGAIGGGITLLGFVRPLVAADNITFTILFILIEIALFYTITVGWLIYVFTILKR